MITFGDVRPEIRKELYKNIGRVVNAKDKGGLLPVAKIYPDFWHVTEFKDIRRDKDEKFYYLIVFAKWVLKDLHTF
jgi:hypothetical protein